MWELLTSSMPFSDFRFDWQIAEAIVEGKCPQLPSSLFLSSSSNVSEESIASYVEIMKECWAPLPKDRPSFDAICKQLLLPKRL